MNSATRRLFPTPGSPLTVTTRGLLSASTLSSAECRTASSRSRPTIGAESAVATSCSPRSTSPTTSHAGTDSTLPFTCSGSSFRRSKERRTRRAVVPPTTISPGAAASWSRAARLTASPVTIRSARGAAAGTGLAGVDADPDLELLGGPVARVPGCETGEHPERGPHRPSWIVLVRRRHAEDGHDRVSDVLLHDAFLRLDLLGHRREVAEQELADVLRMHPAGARGRLTTSANSTVTSFSVSGPGASVEISAPHVGQKRAPSGSRAPHAMQKAISHAHCPRRRVEAHQRLRGSPLGARADRASRRT